MAHDAQQQIAGCRPSPVGAHGRRPRTRTRPSRKDEAELQGVLRGGPAPEPSPASAPPGFGGGACPPPIGFGEPSFLVQAKMCLGVPTERVTSHGTWVGGVHVALVAKDKGRDKMRWRHRWGSCGDTSPRCARWRI